MNSYYENNKSDVAQRDEAEELNFDNCYALDYVERVIKNVYQKHVIKQVISGSKDDFLPPYVFFDGLDSFSFEGLMLFCKLKLHHSNKRYFPIIMKPGVGSVHYVAAILRKDLTREGEARRYVLFFFDPVGHPDEASINKLKKKLSIKNMRNFFGIRLFLSPHAIQTGERDGGHHGLVSCGPLVVEFIKDMMNEPSLIEQLEPNLRANCERGFEPLQPWFLNDLKGDVSQETYSRKILEWRAQHLEIANSRMNVPCAEMGNWFAAMTEEIMDLSEYLQIERVKRVSDDAAFESYLRGKMLNLSKSDPGEQFAQDVSIHFAQKKAALAFNPFQQLNKETQSSVPACKSRNGSEEPNDRSDCSYGTFTK